VYRVFSTTSGFWAMVAIRFLFVMV
jgi:hypothetical protein